MKCNTDTLKQLLLTQKHEIMTNSSSWQNFESKHMHIGYIPTTWPDLTVIWGFWPKFDLLMTWFDLKNLKFEFLTKFRHETYVYWIYFDYLAKFDPDLTILTQVWPSDDLIWPQRISNLYSERNSKSNHVYIGYISTNLPDLTLIWRLWPKFDLLMTWFHLEESWIWILDKIMSRKIC